ncbi:MAG: DNA-3-methyladenine glycosylase [Ignavibacteriaceae bacterium]|nr:DNA-3-methyladenine glycosylase [Ignavibacteriaceae bacterium]
MSPNKFRKLKREFYKRNLLEVTKNLLGKIFVVQGEHFKLSGKIVEVEAYHGEHDEASHAFRGKTKRNEVMFWEGGYLYVYFTYGAHYCANVVVGKKDEGQAVLIRAIEPMEGIDKMKINRFEGRSIKDMSLLNLTNGPGKVCKAFGLNKMHNGIDLTKNHIFILNQPNLKKNEIGISRRIGISKSVDLKWRFFIKDNPYISRK